MKPFVADIKVRNYQSVGDKDFAKYKTPFKEEEMEVVILNITDDNVMFKLNNDEVKMENTKYVEKIKFKRYEQ